MTEEQARKTANVLMGAAAIGIAAFILRSPARRRLVWRLAREFAAGPLAVYASSLVRDAWDQSGQVRRSGIE